MNDTSLFDSLTFNDETTDTSIALHEEAQNRPPFLNLPFHLRQEWFNDWKLQYVNEMVKLELKYDSILREKEKELRKQIERTESMNTNRRTRPDRINQLIEKWNNSLIMIKATEYDKANRDLDMQSKIIYNNIRRQARNFQVNTGIRWYWWNNIDN